MASSDFVDEKTMKYDGTEKSRFPKTRREKSVQDTLLKYWVMTADFDERQAILMKRICAATLIFEDAWKNKRNVVVVFADKKLFIDVPIRPSIHRFICLFILIERPES